MNEEQTINGEEIGGFLYNYPFSFIWDENDNSIKDMKSILKYKIKRFIHVY